MKILYLVPILPYPPDSGAKTHLYNKLRYIGGKHEVHFLCFLRPGESKYLPSLEPYCKSIRAIPLQRSTLRNIYHLAKSLVTGQPFKIVRDFLPAMRDEVQHLLRTEDFDVMHVDEPAMAQYVKDSSGPAKILDKHNTMWLQYRRMWEAEKSWWKKAILDLEWRKLKKYEGEICRKFDRVLVLSQQDRSSLEIAMGENHDTEIDVMSIATDTSPAPVFRKRGSRNILSIASLYFLPNVQATIWFAEKVYPLIKDQVPEARFYVIGARPPREIQDLARGESSIIVTGYVEDILPFLEDSAVMVVPLQSGGGMRWKILNAFVQGIPVVSTHIGCEGFDIVPDKHLLVADEPRGFAEAVCRILRDEDLAQKLSKNARSLAERKYDWQVVYRRLDEIYQELA